MQLEYSKSPHMKMP